MSRKTEQRIDVVVGDLFESQAQTWINTVNTVGVMGKGVALEFKRRFPDMYADYRRRCDHGEVQLGRPYIFRGLFPPFILNFPTKEHWRAASRLSSIEEGLDYLEAHWRQWGITSLAVPPLGCGQGGLEWSVVGPRLYQRLARLPIPVELYAPHGTPHDELQPRYLQRTLASTSSSDITDVVEDGRLKPSAVALVAVLARLERDPHHWPVGKTTFQKLAYFATAAGIPTGLEFERGSYGPFAPGLTRTVTQLANHDLVRQTKLGSMVAHRTGPTFEAAAKAYADDLSRWQPEIDRLTDLLARFRTTRQAEIAATVHFVATRVATNPSEELVLDEVLTWKQKMRPPLSHDEVILTMRSLAMLGWLRLSYSAGLEADEGALTGSAALPH